MDKSGLIYLTSMGYQFSYDKVHGHKFGIKKSKLGYIWKKTEKNLEKKMKEIYLYF